MTVTMVRFHGRDGDFSPKLFRTDRMADALADYCQTHAPRGRRKWAAKRFGLTDEEARTVCEGSPSKATLDKAFRNGGWALVLEVFAILLGERIDQHLEREARRHAERAEILGSTVRTLRSARRNGRDAANPLDTESDRLASEHRGRVGPRPLG